MAEFSHRELTFQIIGCAMKVHSSLGPGFPEHVYHRALIHELLKAKMTFESEKVVEVFYDGALCGEFRLDLLVADTVVVELKALDRLAEDHLAQALSYLKATGKTLALLINFGCKSLDTKRVILSTPGKS